MSASTSASVTSSPKRFTSPRKLGATSSNGSINSNTVIVEGDDEVADAHAVVHGLPCMVDNNFSHSYTWHSAGRYKGKQAGEGLNVDPAGSISQSWKDSNSDLITGSAEEEEQSQEQWILGVDEAGRGPALGPQVYGAAFCPATTSDALKAMGFADSKQLSDMQRTKLMQRILDGEMEERQLCYAVTVMHPQDISAGMLQRANYSLNAQSQDVTIQLIREVLNLGYPLTHIFVDPVGPHEMYASKLSNIFPGIRFTVVPKADALFPVVSAASVVAKVTRDTFMEEWQFSSREAKLPDIDRTFGSGYPSDPRTQAWLERNYDPLFGYPCIARQSWSTIRLLHDKKGYKAKWSEEESVNSIRSYFQSNRQGDDKEKPALLKEMSLSSIAVL